jgi:hypothetical protein
MQPKLDNTTELTASRNFQADRDSGSVVANHAASRQDLLWDNVVIFFFFFLFIYLFLYKRNFLIIWLILIIINID